MNSPDLEKLFETKRFCWNSAPSVLGAIFYFPLGVLLFLVRFFILSQALIAAIIFPHGEWLRSYILRCMSLVLGLVYVERNKDECNTNPRASKVYVANHVTSFDGVVLHLAQGSYSPSKYPFPSILHSALGLFEVPNQMSREDLVSTFRRQIEGEDKSVALFPELATTNCKSGMLKFTTAAFEVQDVVQPVAIEVSRPAFLSIVPSLLNSSLMTDVFWFLFTPYTKYSMRYLPPVRKQEDEDVAEFAKRAQESIASYLNIPITNFGASDKLELIKRLRREQALARQQEAQAWSADPRLAAMANQVKEILPHVPLNVILQDIRRTKSVDLTVTHFVEGQIPFTPEVVPPPSTSRPTVTDLPGPSFSGAALLKQTTSPQTTVFSSDFHKSGEDRQLSLAERKAHLLDNARRAYIEKHGLKIPGYNC